MRGPSRWNLVIPGLVVLVLTPVDSSAQRTSALSDAQEAFQKARQLASGGKHAAAVPLFEKTIRLDPALENAYVAYSDSLYVLGKFAAGEKLLRTAASRFGDHDLVKAKLGMHLYAQKKHQEAYTYLKPSFSSLPQRFEIQVVAGQSCLKAGDNPCAVKALRNYLGSRPPKASKGDHAVRVMLARALVSEKRFKEADKEARLALQLNPKSVAAHLVVADVLLESGNSSGAVTIYERMSRKLTEGQFHPYRIKLGMAYLAQRRHSSAARQARMILKRQPRDRAANLLLGDALFGRRLYSKALTYYRKALAAGDRPEIRLRIARVMFRRRRYKAALAELKPALAKKPDNHVLVLGIRTAVRARKKQNAVAIAQQLLAHKALSAADLYYAGIAHSSAGKFEEAVEIYHRALKKKKQHWGARQEMVRALCYLARRKVRGGDLDAAHALLAKAVQVDPASLVVHRNLAFVSLRMGRDSKAIEHLRVVLKKDATDAVANRLAARALLKLGKKRQALLRLDRAVASVVKHGGLPLARALVETAVVRIQFGYAQTGIVALERALELSRQMPKQKVLGQEIRAYLTRAYLHHAMKLQSKGEDKKAQAVVGKARKLLESLSKQERRRMSQTAALIELFSGKLPQGRVKRKTWTEMASALSAPFRKVGQALLSSYAGVRKQDSPTKLRSATALKRLAKRLPADAGAEVRRLATGAEEEAAARLFAAGKAKAASRVLGKTYRGKRGLSARQQHNLAVVDYAARRTNKAIAVLKNVGRRHPLALCNLAVHHEKSGNFEQAFRLFRKCQQAGGGRWFPGLAKIVKAKARVLGVSTDPAADR